ncbi:carbamoyltransferase HypF [Rhodococcus sp. OK302]|uniref:carbamoyltransferase HypF n=1 Tax=Rhodococcus sp. OK302 TaxID=1882769 RepID=UPI000B93EF5C|nr:carbamoyltransferase HypF [Rhodococcus sp. OK302]OYD69560.1 hydrogenase maturation carbamoyltransferase HypF [Rhodococcus sp. OK302]
MIAASRLIVRGVVQGVGFRPFVYSLATELGLAGSVGNSTRGVVIDLEGRDIEVAEFVTALQLRQPPLARIDSVDYEPAQPRGLSGFRIVETDTSSVGQTLAPPDVATCDDCLREMTDPTNRRFRHPFITCTHCGPRFTIITALPYDRSSTTMDRFPMCTNCAAEYADPADRRFHAQPIACPDCGPTLSFVEPSVGSSSGEYAVRKAREYLRDGKIIAVKGIGGYHLACDARSESAVQELRARKHRRSKPLAVMVRDLPAASESAQVSPAEATALVDRSRPILLVPKASGYTLASSVAPRLPDIGIMLAYNPIQYMLLGLAGDLSGPQVLVMTSANFGGEPIIYDERDQDRLFSLADGILTHDRPIRMPCDDSVQRVVDEEMTTVRRSRGHTPLPIDLPATLPFDVPATLAVGADLKNTFCLAQGASAWLSQHIGDMGDLAVLESFATSESHFESLTGVTPIQVACDEHPGYRSSRWARRHAGPLPVRAVQHHHAHVAAVMGENGCDGDEPVLALAFDGTGYGADGAVWGGEMLLATYKGCQRLAHLKYVPLPGGDIGVERPYRMALSHLWSAGIDWDPGLPPVAACPPRELAVLRHQLETGFGCSDTSSMGRLFDAVSSLIGVRHVADYEAQAAIELEGISRGIVCGSEYYAFDRIDVADSDSWVGDSSSMIRGVVRDLRAGVSAGVIGARFHEAVAQLVLEWALRGRELAGVDDVVLTGGVFQNPLLLSRSRILLREAGFTPLTSRELPPNDGGLAYGQVLVASSS